MPHPLQEITLNILVLNSGSSSIKYQLLQLPSGQLWLDGVVERVGGAQGTDHQQALQQMVAELAAAGVAIDQLDAIGHRVVHGGTTFSAPARIDAEVLAAIRANIALAPLHNPANLLGIEVMQKLAPGVAQVAVFDTAFHQTLPPHAYRYAVTESLLRDHGVRRFGFHGSSHRYVAGEAARLLGRPLDQLRLISLHLGNGASACAILQGRSIDTSMGMTPLEGLVMGSRSGDIDPGVVFHLQRSGMGPDQVERLLNREGGLLGMCGVSDMREVLARVEEGDQSAELAVALFCYRIRKYIGAYFAILGGLDALLFTGGIGEHSPAIRAECCAGLGHLGLLLDAERNQRSAPLINQTDSLVSILAIATNEELEIARQVAATLAPATTTDSD